MIHVDRLPEPDGFRENVRQKGLRKSLASSKKLRAYWREWPPCIDHLAKEFHDRCAYTAMEVPPLDGQVDHFLSQENRPSLAYEWTNYRYCRPKLNSRKKPRHDGRLLDPFDVEDGWFEIDLATQQLLVTDAVPSDQRERADFTLETLKLNNDDKIVELRRTYYRRFLTGKFSLGILDATAPLTYRAILKALEAIPEEIEQRLCFQRFLRGEWRLQELRENCPVVADAVEAVLPPCPEEKNY